MGMPLTPEGKVKQEVKKVLKHHGIWYFMPQNVGLGSSGVPDFICCVSLTTCKQAGKFLGIECKAKGKRSNTSALQNIQIAAIQSAGGWALVVDDAAQLEEFLRDHCSTTQSTGAQGE